MKRLTPAEVWAQGKTVITAHSGCENTPPNSREHILAAIASGSEMIEFDVRMLNGELVLSHDEPKDGEVCVTLRECFSMVAPEENLHMNIDVKTEGLIEPVMALAKEFPLEESFLRALATMTARLRFRSARICGAVCGRGWKLPMGLRITKKTEARSSTSLTV